MSGTAGAISYPPVSIQAGSWIRRPILEKIRAMLYVDIPTRPDIRSLIEERADACVSLYLSTTPETQHVGASRIAFGNLVKQALEQLDAVDFDKRRRALLAEQFDDLIDDGSFWTFQAHSLAVLATPDSIRTFRLPNRLHDMAQVSDRFHLKPLLRAVTFPHRAFVLALAEKGPRLIEVSADLPAAEVNVKDMPKDAGSATGRASVNDRSPSGRIHGSEGQKVLLRQYARQIDAVLRPFLSGRDEPLILAATEPLLSTYRSVNTYPGLAGDAISASPVEKTPSQIAEAARPVIDGLNAARIAAFAELYESRAQQGRATSDLSQAARAATFGAIDTLLVDMDEVVPGTVDEADGTVHLSKDEGAKTYGVVDEIAGRALVAGATVLAVRRDDIPGGASLAAILRYAL
ncbi:hypothetical protein ACJ4V0_14260 [Phreatobacter sp. HK31-P]